MQQRIISLFIGLVILIGITCGAIAQTAPAPAYGTPVGIDMAKKIAAAAVAEARKNNFTMAISVVDTAGNLVYFEKMDGTQTGSVNVSMEKARSAALFKRPTKVFQDAVAQGGVGLRMLGLPGAVPVDGGIPLIDYRCDRRVRRNKRSGRPMRSGRCERCEVSGRFTDVL